MLANRSIEYSAYQLIAHEEKKPFVQITTHTKTLAAQKKLLKTFPAAVFVRPHIYERLHPKCSLTIVMLLAARVVCLQQLLVTKC